VNPAQILRFENGFASLQIIEATHEFRRHALSAVPGVNLKRVVGCEQDRFSMTAAYNCFILIARTGPQSSVHGLTTGIIPPVYMRFEAGRVETTALCCLGNWRIDLPADATIAGWNESISDTFHSVLE